MTFARMRSILMDTTIKEKKRKYKALADEMRSAGSSGRTDSAASVIVSSEAPAQPGTSQARVVDGGKRQRLGNDADRRPIKRLQYSKTIAIDAVDAALDRASTAPDTSPRKTDINAIPVETFALIGAYVGLNALEMGRYELTKLRILNRASKASIDNLSEIKKVEPTLHAVETTRYLIESAHIKRKRQDDFFEYSKEDGNGDPETWTKGYLHGHVEDIYAVMKFSDPDYNSALLRAALKDADQVNLQSQGGMLYRFALNAKEFNRAEREAIADASVEILESRKGGQIPAAKAYLHLRDNLSDDEALQSHLRTLDPEVEDKFQNVFRRAEKERAVPMTGGVSAEAQRKCSDLHCIRDAASYRSAHGSAWNSYKEKIADKFKREVRGEFKKGDEAELLTKAAIGLRGTDEGVKTEDVAIALREELYDVMSYREAEKSLAIATRETISSSEKRATLLERSRRMEGRAE